MDFNSKDFIKDLVALPSANFLYHLNIPGNARIIFSGPFGTGKSTFLKYFYGKSEYKDKYKVVHLAPVNYSIMSNEDIFKYIKYDILFELIDKHKLEFVGAFESQIKKNKNIRGRDIIEFLKLFILAIPGLGKQYHQLSGEIEKFVDKINGELKEDESTQVNDFMKQFLGAGYYEADLITKIIAEKVNALSGVLKGNPQSKIESILVIDDLDRLDPDHIFRLFNVFSAHLDSPNITTKNKFGFDKIIFVCDIMNIRNIFHHKYGKNTDFGGYIDKFFSVSVHYHKNNFESVKLINDFVNSLQNIDRGFVYYNEIEPEVFEILKDVLILSNENNLINLRELLKFRNKALPVRERGISIKNFSFKNTKFPILILLECLLGIFGAINHLKETLQKLSEVKIKVDFSRMQFFYHLLLTSDLYFLTHLSNGSRRTYIMGANTYVIEEYYELHREYSVLSPRLIDKNFFSGTTENKHPHNFYKLLLRCLNHIDANGYFK